MNIPVELKNYIVDVDGFSERFVESEINKLGFQTWFNNSLKWIDCTRLFEGKRINNTNCHIYKSNISDIIYGIYFWNNDDPNYLEYCLNQLIDKHKSNLEYEKINPPEPIPEIKTRTNKSKSTKSKTEKVPKETIKQVKHFTIKLKI